MRTYTKEQIKLMIEAYASILPEDDKDEWFDTTKGVFRAFTEWNATTDYPTLQEFIDSFPETEKALKKRKR